MIKQIYKKKASKEKIVSRKDHPGFNPETKILLHLFSEINIELARGRKQSITLIRIFIFWNMLFIFSREFTFTSLRHKEKMLEALQEIIYYLNIFEYNNAIIPLLIINSILSFFVLTIFAISLLSLWYNKKFYKKLLGFLQKFLGAFFWILFIPIGVLNMKIYSCLLPRELSIQIPEFCTLSTNTQAGLVILSSINLICLLIFGFCSCVLTFKVFFCDQKDYMRHMQFSFNIGVFFFTCLIILHILLYSSTTFRPREEIAKDIILFFFSIFLARECFYKYPFFKNRMNASFLFLYILWGFVTLINLIAHLFDIFNINIGSFLSPVYLLGFPLLVRLSTNLQIRQHGKALTCLANSDFRITKEELLYALANLKVKYLNNINKTVWEEESLIPMGILYNKNEAPVKACEYMSEKYNRRKVLNHWNRKMAEYKIKAGSVKWEQMNPEIGKSCYFYLAKALYLLNEANNYSESYFYFKKAYNLDKRYKELFSGLIYYQVKHIFKSVFRAKILDLHNEGKRLNFEDFFEMEKKFCGFSSKINNNINIHLDFWKEQAKQNPHLRSLINYALALNRESLELDKIYKDLISYDFNFDSIVTRAQLLYAFFKVYVEFDVKYMKNLETLTKITPQRVEPSAKANYEKIPDNSNSILAQINAENITSNSIEESVVLKIKIEEGDRKKIIDASKNCHKTLGIDASQLIGGSLDFILPSTFVGPHSEAMKSNTIYSDWSACEINAYLTLAKHSEGYLITVKKIIRISPNTEAGLSFIAILIPVKSEQQSTFFLCTPEGTIDSTSENLFGYVKSIEHNKNSISKMSVFDFSPMLRPLLKLVNFSISTKDQGISLSFTKKEQEILKTIIESNHMSHMGSVFENLDSNFIKALYRKLQNKGIVIDIGPPPSKSDDFQISSNSHKLTVLSGFSYENNNIFKNMYFKQKSGKFFPFSTTSELVSVVCKVETFRFSNGEIVLLVKINNTEPLFKERLSENLEEKTGENDQLFFIEDVEIEVFDRPDPKQHIYQGKRYSGNKEAIAARQNSSYSEDKEIKLSELAAPETEDIQDKILKYHYSQFKSDNTNFGDSSSVKNSRNGEFNLRRSKALFKTIRTFHTPKMIRYIQVIEGLFYFLFSSLVITTFTSNRFLFMEVDSLVKIVKEGENRQAALIDIYRKSVAIRYFITGFGSPYRDLTTPKINMIDKYVSHLKFDVKSFEETQFLLKNSLNNRMSSDILLYEDKSFEIFRFNEKGDKNIDKTDIFQFSKILAEIGTRLSDGNYTRILTDAKRIIALKFMEGNLLNAPLVTTEFLSNIIFKNVLTQLESHKIDYYQIFYALVSITIVFGFTLVYLSVQYLKRKTNLAPLLILIEPSDCEYRINALGKILGFFIDSNKTEEKQRKAKNFEKPRPTSKVEIKPLNPISDPFNNSRNQQHRRTKVPNIEGLSQSFNLILLACLISVTYIFIFRILNYQSINSYLINVQILTTRMKVIFDRNSLHNILGVSLLGLMNTQNFEIKSQNAETVFLSALEEYRKYDAIYHSFLDLRDDPADQTFEDFNSINFCPLFNTSNCFDSPIVSKGWINFEGAYANLISDIYAKYKAEKSNYGKLKALYDSDKFLEMEAAIVRGGVIYEHLRNIAYNELVIRIDFALSSLSLTFIISMIGTSIFFFLLIFRQSQYLKSSFNNIRFTFSLIPHEFLLKNKMIMNYFISTTPDVSQQRLFKI